MLKVVGLHIESGESSTGKVEVLNRQEVNLNQSTTWQHSTEVEGEATAFPSMPCVSKLHMECGELSSQFQNTDKFMSGKVSFPPISNLIAYLFSSWFK